MRRMLGNKTLQTLAVGLSALTVLTLVRVADPTFVSTIRDLTFDLYQRIKPREAIDVPVRVIDIDEASLAREGQWPWPRTRIVRLIDTVMSMGAAVVVFDVIFSEPDRTSPARIAEDMADQNQALRAMLAKLPDHDRLLANAIAEWPVVLGFAVHQAANDQVPAEGASFAYGGTDPKTILRPFPGAIVSLPQFQNNAAGHGSISLSPVKTDNVVRRVPLLVTVGGNMYAGLSVEALRVAQGASTVIVRTSTASGEFSGGFDTITEIRVGGTEVPLTDRGELWMYYARDRASRYISAHTLLSGSAEDLRPLQPKISGHIIFVGSSAVGLHDLRATSLGALTPGVAIHAQAVEQMIAGEFLARPDWGDGVELLGAAAIGLIICLALPWLGAFFSWLLGVIFVAAIAGGAWYAFSVHGLLLDPLYPAGTAILVYLFATGTLYISTERDKRFVRRAFQQYLAPELLARLEMRPEALKLGGEIRPLTLLFMDVRGFTPISEQLTPEELVEFLNRLLSPLSEAIQDRGGTIDKYIGDSIMAFWNAPLLVEDHPRRACEAALHMREILARMNNEDAFQFAARGFSIADVAIGVGLNTGEGCVGNMGSQRRFNYSVVGDAVNVAARIESSCKAVGWDLLVSQSTRNAVADFAFLEAGEIPLKGKSEPVKLFALIGDDALARSPEFRKLADCHGNLIEALKGGQTETIARLSAQCRELGRTELESFYRLLLERSDSFRLSTYAPAD